jgi:hypothetical protein
MVTKMRIVEGFQKAKPLLTREIPRYGAAPEATVKRILAEVRAKGDKALFTYTKKLDGVELKSLDVSNSEISDAYKKVDKKLLAALKLAADRIEQFHFLCKQRLEPGFLTKGLGRLIRHLRARRQRCLSLDSADDRHTGTGSRSKRNLCRHATQKERGNSIANAGGS